MKVPLTIFLLVLTVQAQTATKELTVASVTRQGDKAVIRLVNNSPKPITAFVVAITASFSDKTTANSEFTEDFGPEGKPLAPGNAYDETQSFSPPEGTHLTGVKAKVITTIYSDQTGEASSDEAFNRLLQVRVAMATASRQAQDILEKGLQQDQSSHPSATIAAALDQAMYAAKVAKHHSTENTWLLDEKKTVLKANDLAATNNTSERDFLEQHKAALQKTADQLEAYANIRRVQ